MCKPKTLYIFETLQWKMLESTTVNTIFFCQVVISIQNVLLGCRQHKIKQIFTKFKYYFNSNQYLWIKVQTTWDSNKLNIWTGQKIRFQFSYGHQTLKLLDQMSLNTFPLMSRCQKCLGQIPIEYIYIKVQTTWDSVAQQIFIIILTYKKTNNITRIV